MLAEDDLDQWYWASALFKAVHVDRPRRRNVWEQKVFLVRAAADHEAWSRAETMARAREHEYLAATGDTVRWCFEEIEDVQPLHDGDLASGSEVFWRFFERVDPREQHEAA